MKLTSCLLPLLLLSAGPVFAFPPTPHHTIYGTVRDALGNPMVQTNAEVRLETTTGQQLKTTVSLNLPAGMNYRLTAPLDAGVTADNYKATALRRNTPFTMKVKLGTTIYLPMEMTFGGRALGHPAEGTRLDLTLGVDSDGDGLPDAWELALIAMLGGGLTLPDILPNGDADGDGISNWQEYLAGTYPFDPADGFRLALLPQPDGRVVLEFLAIPGRRYSLHSSASLTGWTAHSFRLQGEPATAPPRSSFTATEVRFLRLEPVASGEVPPEKLFYKAQVQ